MGKETLEECENQELATEEKRLLRQALFGFKEPARAYSVNFSKYWMDPAAPVSKTPLR